MHDLHIWSLCSEYAALSVHVIIEEQSTSDARRIVDRVGAMLAERYRIIHTTIQPESVPCAVAASAVCSQEHSH